MAVTRQAMVACAFDVLIDAHSKWVDIHIVQSATSAVTIRKLRQSFSNHGIPDLIVSDNGTNFTSSEMEGFLRSNGVQHICSAPYHPASNGLAERAVQTLKNSLRKEGVVSLHDRVQLPMQLPVLPLANF